MALLDNITWCNKYTKQELVDSTKIPEANEIVITKDGYIFLGNGINQYKDLVATNPTEGHNFPHTKISQISITPQSRTVVPNPYSGSICHVTFIDGTSNTFQTIDAANSSGMSVGMCGDDIVVQAGTQIPSPTLVDLNIWKLD